jgi:hypothetical protein
MHILKPISFCYTRNRLMLSVVKWKKEDLFLNKNRVSEKIKMFNINMKELYLALKIPIKKWQIGE